jgi:hypothetical protein
MIQLTLQPLTRFQMETSSERMPGRIDPKSTRLSLTKGGWVHYEGHLSARRDAPQSLISQVINQTVR